MVRFTAVLGLTAVLGTLLASAVAAEPQNGAVSPLEVKGAALPQAYMPRRLQSPVIRISLCDVCAGLTCTTVRVRGRCTLDNAIDALRRQEARQGPARKHVPERLRHRERAVSKGDFRELAPSSPSAQIGRAKASPRHRPQDGAVTASRLLDLHEMKGHALTVREHRSSKLNTQAFQPLKLSEEAPDDTASEATNKENEPQP